MCHAGRSQLCSSSLYARLAYRLLQNSLGGNSRTLMIACVSPSSHNEQETQSTMMYATNARKIKNTVLINTDVGSMEAAELKREARC